MSGPEAPKPDDKLLAEFLAGEGGVREAYHGAASEHSPTDLDAAILAAAKAAARSAPSLRRNWQTPMAAAAVLVMSFGVLLQLQRDPAAQKAVMSVASESAGPTAAPGSDQAAPKATPIAEVAATEKRERVVARAMPEQVADQPLAAPVDARPPPSAMPAAPAPVIAVAAESTAKGMEADAVAPRAAKQAMAQASAAARESSAAGSAMASNLAAESDQRKIPVAVLIEQWAQGCATSPGDLEAGTLWRGLALASWASGPDGAVLLFAEGQTQAAIKAALGSLADKATPASPSCGGAMVRELRPAVGAWALVCECHEDRD